MNLFCFSLLIWDEHAYSCSVKYLYFYLYQIYNERKMAFSMSTSRIYKKKDATFLNKILWKIAGKVVLDDLNCKIFFISQPWRPTGFLGIYQLTARNLKWPPKSEIIWPQWLPGFKMLFPALSICVCPEVVTNLKNNLYSPLSLSNFSSYFCMEKLINKLQLSLW